MSNDFRNATPSSTLPAPFLLALILKGVISALLFAYTVYTAGVILPVIAGFYRHKLKVTPSAALIAIIGGGEGIFYPLDFKGEIKGEY